MLRISPLKNKRGKGSYEGERPNFKMELVEKLNYYNRSEVTSCYPVEVITTLPMSFPTSFWSLQKSNTVLAVIVF